MSESVDILARVSALVDDERRLRQAVRRGELDADAGRARIAQIEQSLDSVGIC